MYEQLLEKAGSRLVINQIEPDIQSPELLQQEFQTENKQCSVPTKKQYGHIVWLAWPPEQENKLDFWMS